MFALNLYLAMGCLVAIAVIAFGLIAVCRRPTRRYGKSCLIVGSSAFAVYFVTATVGITIQQDSEAHVLGFLDAADLRSAKAAGVGDAGIWHQQAAIAKEKAEWGRALQKLALAKQLEQAILQKEAAAAQEAAAWHRAEFGQAKRTAAADEERKRREAAVIAAAQARAIEQAKAAAEAKAKQDRWEAARRRDELEQAKRTAAADEERKRRESAVIREAQARAIEQAKAAAEAKAKQDGWEAARRRDELEQAKRTAAADEERKRREAAVIREAQARAVEQVKVTAEVKVEQDRVVATQLARQHEAAEDRARQAEKDRLLEADAEQAIKRYKEIQEKYVASATRTIQLLMGSIKDPSSASVRDLRESHLVGGQIALCGLINGRNSFGAMTGYKRFVAVGDLNIAEIETDFDNSKFLSAWSNYCFE